MTTPKDLLRSHGNAFLDVLTIYSMDVEDQSYIIKMTQTLLDFISGIEHEGRLVLRKPMINPSKNSKTGYLSKLLKVLQVASSNQVQLYGFFSIANSGLISYTTDPSVATCSTLPLKNDENLYRIDFHSPHKLIAQTDSVGLISLGDFMTSRKRLRTLEDKLHPGIPVQNAMGPMKMMGPGIPMQGAMGPKVLMQGAMGPGIPIQMDVPTMRTTVQPGPGIPFPPKLPAKVAIQLPFEYHSAQEPAANHFMQKQMFPKITVEPQVAAIQCTVESQVEQETVESQCQDLPTQQECLFQFEESTTDLHEEIMLRFLEIDKLTTYFDEMDNNEATGVENEDTNGTVGGEETPQVVIDSMHMIQPRRFSPGPSPPPPPHSPREEAPVHQELPLTKPTQNPVPSQNPFSLADKTREPFSLQDPFAADEPPSSPGSLASPNYPPTSPDSPH